MHRSAEWKCPQCGAVKTILLPVTEASKALNKEAAELGSQIKLQVIQTVDQIFTSPFAPLQKNADNSYYNTFRNREQ